VYAYPQKTFPNIDIRTKKSLARDLIIMHGNIQRTASAEESKARVLRMARLLEAIGTEKQRICGQLTLSLPYTNRHIERLLGKEGKQCKMATIPKSRTGSTFAKSALSRSLDQKAKEVQSALSLQSTLTDPINENHTIRVIVVETSRTQ
jgi:hypothetical protein